ncbi:MAG: DNA-directed RNA polymerase subunit omega [Myxococcota bacterium]
MARVTVEDCLTKVENRFALVHLAAARARQIRVDGQEPMVKASNKECVVALREVAAGHVYSDMQIQDIIEGDG